MNVAGLRFFSVYQGYGGAERHKGEYANVIAQFADDMANGESPVLYGDGEQTRDFTHVEDIVRGIELAADHELTGIYNLGTGNAYSFNTVVELLNDELGTDIEPEYVGNPIPEDVYVHDTCAGDLLLAVNGEGAKLPQAVGRSPTTARLPEPHRKRWDICRSTGRPVLVGRLSPSMYRTGAPKAGPDSRYSYPERDSELPSLAYSPPHSGRCSRPVRSSHTRTSHARHGSNRLSSRTHQVIDVANSYSSTRSTSIPRSSALYSM